METSNKLCYWFLFYKDQLLLQKENDTYTIPYGENPPVPVSHTLEVDYRDGLPARTAELDTPVEGNDRYVHMGLRASWDYISRACYEKAGKAFQLLYWDSHSRFCPVCGTKTEMKDTIMKKCPACGNEMYPSISAAILVLVRKEDSLLLVHARNFKGTFYSLVAGFLETGETLEECVMREVKEETGYTLTSWRFRGLVTFVTEAENSKTVEYMEYMCLYTADGFTGEPIACDEGELAWVKKEDVLHLNLWEGDKIFFRLLNEDEPFFCGMWATRSQKRC